MDQRNSFVKSTFRLLRVALDMKYQLSIIFLKFRFVLILIVERVCFSCSCINMDCLCLCNVLQYFVACLEKACLI